MPDDGPPPDPPPLYRPPQPVLPLDFGEVMPVAPIPVAPYYPPAGYAQRPAPYTTTSPATPTLSKPGWPIALGLAGLFVGGLGVILNILCIVAAVGLFEQTQRAVGLRASHSPAWEAAAPELLRPAEARAMADASVVPEPTTGEAAVQGRPDSAKPVGPRGLNRRQRDAVLAGFAEASAAKGHTPLTPDRRAQLDALLEQWGKEMFADLFKDASAPPPGGRQLAEDVRERVGAQGREFGSKARPGADYYELPGGRIRVYDDRASFRPHGGGEVRYAVASPEDVVTANDEGTVAAPAGGAPAYSTTPPAPIAPAPAAAAPTAPPPLPTASLRIVIVESTASILAAALLIAAAVLLFRRSPRAARLHLLYAIVKIPLLLVGVFAWTALLRVLQSALRDPAGGLARDLSDLYSSSWGIFGELTLIGSVAYAACLLIVFRLSAVRAYLARR